MDDEKQRQIKEEVGKRLREIEQHKEDAEKKSFEFASLNEFELAKKLQRTKSPYIYAMGWNPHGTPGSSISAYVYIANPSSDPYQVSLYLSLFFGVANFLEIGEALDSRLKEWPVLTSPSVSLAPGESRYLKFDYQIPTGITTGTTYLANPVLWKCNYFDVGDIFDRATFYVNVE
jgi:hypothetical protein